MQAFHQLYYRFVLLSGAEAALVYRVGREMWSLGSSTWLRSRVKLYLTTFPGSGLGPAEHCPSDPPWRLIHPDRPSQAFPSPNWGAVVELAGTRCCNALTARRRRAKMQKLGAKASVSAVTETTGGRAKCHDCYRH